MSSNAGNNNSTSQSDVQRVSPVLGGTVQSPILPALNAEGRLRSGLHELLPPVGTSSGVTRGNPGTEGNIRRRTYAQGKFWLLTLRKEDMDLPTALPNGIKWMKGQLERGAENGFLHWQFVVCFHTKVRASVVKLLYPTAHIELSRSCAANEYVFKDDTAVEPELNRFELGNLRIKLFI